MQLIDQLDHSSEESREVKDLDEVKLLLDQVLKFDWKFDYLVLSGKKVTSQPAELTSVDEIPNAITVVGDFSELDAIQTKDVYFRANNGGLSLVFKSELIDCIDFFTKKECKFFFPDNLRLSQLRSAVRISFTKLHDIPVTFYPLADNVFTGKVVDLSETGAKIKFVGNILEHLDIEEIVADCQLLLPGDTKIDSRIQVMGCVYDEESDISFVRCKFLQLNNNSELQLKQFIFMALNELKNKNRA